MNSLAGLSIAVTGATGSFGSALVKRILQEGPHRLVVFSRGEHKQADLRRELGDDQRLRWFIGDIRNRTRLAMAFREVDIVVNCAALKRVEVCEREPEEATSINVDGLRNVLGAAMWCGVGKVLQLSSDKAPDPETFYGTTKLHAEKLATHWNNYSYPRGCRTAVVRWGNVLGSAGSVVHTFRREAKAGRPLPITNPEMTRFWITMDQAVEFCLRVLDEMRGGEIFVPKMRASSILDLAIAVCDAGNWNAPSKIVGPRGAEKIHETIITKAEALRALDLDWGYVIEPTWRMPATRSPWRGTAVMGAITSETVERMKLDELAQAVAAVPEERA